MRYFRKNERGFTLIELLIVVVIIGILAAVGVPIYSRYITSARASEAPTQIMALREYAQSYLRAHPDLLFASSGLLGGTAEDCDAVAAASGNCSEGGTEDWVNQVVGADNVYFSYSWDSTDYTLRATANADLCDSCEGDQMIFSFNPQGGGGTWGVNDMTSRLVDVLP